MKITCSRLVGDQIVEINGKRVSAFDEFLERFLAAQAQAEPGKDVKRLQKTLKFFDFIDFSIEFHWISFAQGFPIVFSVLRREAPEGPESKAERDSARETTSVEP